jgi:uncharacterized repeat protein (TIGR03803 family)
MKQNLASKRLAVTLVVLVSIVGKPLAYAGTKSSNTGTYSQVYFFQGGADGQWPVGGLVGDANGNFYGTTQAGGTTNLGTVYSIDALGTHTVIYNFQGVDGALPSSALVLTPAGDLYGTTYSGGVNNLGTVFKLTPSSSQWQETVVYSFQGNPDGGLPVAGLLLDSAGNFYGTTGFGGKHNKGTVFEIDAQGRESVLYSFKGGADGAYPLAPLIMDEKHNLYGTTTEGGKVGQGTVFSLSASGQEEVVYGFEGYWDGAFPYFSSVYRDAKGNFYGTTPFGGSQSILAVKQNLGGLYTISPTGSEFFDSFCGGIFFACDPAGNLLYYKGKLYGTSLWFQYPGFVPGYGGTLFSITEQGLFTPLHGFDIQGPTETDGMYPVATLAADPKGGAIYGTTFSSTGSGFGMIFSYKLP